MLLKRQESWYRKYESEFCAFENIIQHTGILRDKTMDDKLIYIPNDEKQIFFSVDYNMSLTLNLLNQPIKI